MSNVNELPEPIFAELEQEQPRKQFKQYIRITGSSISKVALFNRTVPQSVIRYIAGQWGSYLSWAQMKRKRNDASSISSMFELTDEDEEAKE